MDKQSLRKVLEAFQNDAGASETEKELATRLLKTIPKLSIVSEDKSVDIAFDIAMSSDLRMEIAKIASSYGCVIVYDNDTTCIRGRHNQAVAFKYIVDNALSLCKDIDDIDVAIAVLRKIGESKYSIVTSLPDVKDCNVEYVKTKHIGKRKMNKADKLLS
jgi:hypothetical protein